jgi:hypothetical protein
VAEYAGDGNFLGSTNQLSPSQVANTPPVAGAITIQRDPARGVKIAVAALLGKVTDEDGDPITFVGTSATSLNNGTLVRSGDWIFYTPAAGFTNADSFTYSVSDGYVTVTGSVTVDIRVELNSSVNLAIANQGNGSHVIHGDGIPGRTYTIQYADGVPHDNWQTLGTATADSVGQFEFTDTSGSSQRYYRSVGP